MGARGVGSPSNHVLQAPFPAEMLLLGCKEDSRNGSFSIAQVSEMFLIRFSPHSLPHAGLEAATRVKCWLLVWARSWRRRHWDAKGKPFFLEALSYSFP